MGKKAKKSQSDDTIAVNRKARHDYSFEEYIEAAAIKAKSKNPRPKYVGRVACASPATGYASYHKEEQEALVKEALS